MNKDGYPDNAPRQFVPIRPIGYVGYNLLFAIPFVGLIMIIVFALIDENINRRNYARSFLWTMLIVFIITLIVALLMFALAMVGGALKQ